MAPRAEPSKLGSVIRRTARGTLDHRPPSLDAWCAPESSEPKRPDQASDGLMPTTSVLTATTLTYAIRAGITAGAGTRLVL